jgi:hypothetical protein
MSLPTARPPRPRNDVLYQGRLVHLHLIDGGAGAAGYGAEITERYGSGRDLAEVSGAWRPYRTWAAVHLRVLREQRTGEIAGRPGTPSDHALNH